MTKEEAIKILKNISKTMISIIYTKKKIKMEKLEEHILIFVMQ